MIRAREEYEGLISGAGEARWNQSWYFQAYDAATRTGAFIRLGLLENQREANTWLIVFRDGRPLFTRTNLNLPYTTERPRDGIRIAGLHIHAQVPLKRARIEFESPDFSLALTWDERTPMEDCIALSQDQDGSFAREIAHIHLEGTCSVRGHIEHRGQRAGFSGSGFRDVAAGVRNWDGLKHYRLAWPVFENGVAIAGVHGYSTSGHSAWMRMLHDGQRWNRIQHTEEEASFDAEGFSVTQAQWRFVDEQNRRWEFQARPLFGWLFPTDTFVVREQLMEYRLADGTLGHGLFETGYRLPWTGL